MRERQVVIITFKNGKVRMKGNADRRHRDLAIAKLRADEPEPTFCMKVRRFGKRLYLTAKHDYEKFVTAEDAADITPIGVTEWS